MPTAILPLARVVLAGLVVAQFLSAPDSADRPGSGFRSRPMRPFLCGRSFGSALAYVGLGGLLLLLIATPVVIRRSRSSRSLARLVGILWDLMSFWSPAAHPFVPPPYAFRAVGDLQDRILKHLRADPENRVVLAGTPRDR